MTALEDLADKAQRAREDVYQANRARGLSDYELETVCFREAPFGTPLKGEFCIGMTRLSHPWVQFEVDGKSNFWTKRILRNLCKHKFLSLLGCSSSSKTFSTAIYCYNTWKSRLGQASIYLSTTSAEGGEARTWGAVKDLFSTDKFRIGTRIDYRHMIVMEAVKNDKERDYRDSISSVLIKTGAEGENVLSSIVGRKNDVVIWCADELPFLDSGVLEARMSLVSNPFFQWCGIGNKPNEGDPLYLDAEPHAVDYPDSWQTEGLIKRTGWRTKRGFCLYFDGEKSPNMAAPPDKPIPFPKLANRNFIATIAGDPPDTDSPSYLRWVRGFPVAGDLQDKVLTMKVLENNRAFEDPVWGGAGWTSLAGLDLGFRKDGDPCVADFVRVGKDSDGNTIMAHEKDSVVLTPKVSQKGDYNEQVANRFLDECETRGCHFVALDISADGGIFSHALARIAAARNYAMEILPVSFSGSPDENEWFDVGGERKTAKELFDRKVSQLWYSYRLTVENKLVRGSSKYSRAVKQLCERKVIQDEKRRWKVETKDMMKQRLKRSPDDADARVLAHVAARKHGLAKSVETKRSVTLPWSMPEKSEGRAYASTHQRQRAYARR